MPINLEDQPATYEDAVDTIVANLDPEEITNLSKSGYAPHHFGAGMALRNGWNLWGAIPDEPKTLFNHMTKRFGPFKCPGDDICGLIFDGVIAKVKGEPFDIVQAAQENHNYYKRRDG